MILIFIDLFDAHVLGMYSSNTRWFAEEKFYNGENYLITAIASISMLNP